MEQALPQPSPCGASFCTTVSVGAEGAGATATAFSLPSVFFTVDFSTWEAERERR